MGGAAPCWRLGWGRYIGCVGRWAGTGETGGSGKFLVVMEVTNIGLVAPGIGEAQGDTSVEEPSMVGRTWKGEGINT